MRPHFEEVGIAVESAAELNAFDTTFALPAEHVGGDGWFGALMGQSGLMVGLTRYEDVWVLQRMWTGVEDDEASAHETVTGVTFNEARDIPTADPDAATARGWPVARLDACPEVMQKERACRCDHRERGSWSWWKGACGPYPSSFGGCRTTRRRGDYGPDRRGRADVRAVLGNRRGIESPARNS